MSRVLASGSYPSDAHSRTVLLGGETCRMRVCETVADMRASRIELGGTVGLVPTMGALHEGHLALVRQARAESENVVLSIFVNPTQFASRDEAERYPRGEERDLQLASEAGVDVVFMPDAGEVYPPAFSTFIDVGEIAEPLEGASRPGHFRGVATVVLKLLNIVQPDRGYFGEKDIQQLLVIRRMVRDLNVPVDIVGVPTVRDEHGIALSSRNRMLSPQELVAARCLNQALNAARDRWEQGERNADVLREHMEAIITREPLAVLDYASVADPATLKECLDGVTGSAIASLAVRFGNVRLIDNMSLG